jgi:NAD(P)-dependent dehydrogenase (short-subunit alcohol dehydrogenase family)
MNNMQDKAVIVTGSGGGLGRAYALALAAEGASVVVNDISNDGAEETVAMVKDAGGTAVASVGSVTDWDFAASLIDTSIATFGRLDGLVNNAAIIHDRLPWEEDETSLRRAIEINVLGAMFCGTNALRHMVAQDSGAIVNISSGSYLGLSGVSTYGATKGAIASMTYGWAVEVQGTGVRVNAIMPRALTQMSTVRGTKSTSLGLSGKAVAPSPTPDVIAPLVVYLLSDRAAAINGQIVRNDGQEITSVQPPFWQPGVAIDGRVPFDTMAAAVEQVYGTGSDSK